MDDQGTNRKGLEQLEEHGPLAHWIPSIMIVSGISVVFIGVPIGFYMGYKQASSEFPSREMGAVFFAFAMAAGMALAGVTIFGAGWLLAHVWHGKK